MLAGAAAARGDDTHFNDLLRGIITHMVLDAIPHEHYNTDSLPQQLTDLAFGLAAVAVVYGADGRRWCGALGGALLDLLSLAPGTGRHATRAQGVFHARPTSGPRTPVVVQVAATLAAVALLRQRQLAPGLGDGLADRAGAQTVQLTAAQDS